jgi:hypothetical protein
MAAATSGATFSLASVPWPLGGLQPAHDCFRLLDVVVSRAPEEQAAGYAADGDGDSEFGDAEDPVLHGGRAHAVGDRQASGVI